MRSNSGFSIFDFGLAAPFLSLEERPGEGAHSLSLRGRLGGGFRSPSATIHYPLTTSHSPPASHYPLTNSRPSRHRRAAFTLIELLVTITIIGLLAALALGGMYRANLAAKQTNSKTTISKVAMQINEIWESYRTRKLPIDPRLVLQPTSGVATSPYYMQYCAATGTNNFSPGWLPYIQTIRNTATPGLTAVYPDPSTLGTNPNNNLQIAALRLAATRELMRLELPCTFNDFLTPKATGASVDPNPANNWAPVKTLLIPQPLTAGGVPLANPGGLSEQYRQFFKANATTYNESYQNAECLYLIIKFASQNELGQRNITDDPRLVGDVDGDGMPEIQDSFVAGTFTPPQPGSPYTLHNNPISFIRWPAGFYSDLQPGPQNGQTNNDYAAARHDIFDPLRLDPRAFTLTPLVFSGGMDGSHGLLDWRVVYTQGASVQNVFYLNDPYWTDSNGLLLGVPVDSTYNDNLTNHQLSTRVK